MLKAQQVAMGVVGAGSKGVVSGLTQGLAPGVGIADDLVTGAAGFAMAQWGKGWVVDFGLGMALASIGALVAEPIERLFGNVMGENGIAVTKTAATTFREPVKEPTSPVYKPPASPWLTNGRVLFAELLAAKETGDIRNYIALKYGVAG